MSWKWPELNDRVPTGKQWFLNDSGFLRRNHAPDTKLYWSCNLSKFLFELVIHSETLGLQELLSVQSKWPSTSENIIISLIHYTVPIVNDWRALSGWLVGKLSVYVSGSIVGILPGDLSSSSFKVPWVTELAQVWEWLRIHDHSWCPRDSTQIYTHKAWNFSLFSDQERL